MKRAAHRAFRRWERAMVQARRDDELSSPPKTKFLTNRDVA